MTHDAGSDWMSGNNTGNYNIVISRINKNKSMYAFYKQLIKVHPCNELFAQRIPNILQMSSFLF